MWKRVLGVVLTLTVASCGGSNQATAPTPTPVKQTITSGTYTATAHFSHFISFTTTAPGQVNIRVSWGNASNTLWVDLSASCTSDQFVAGTCQFISSDRSLAPVAQKMSVVSSLAAGTYVLIIDNRGPADENVSYEIDLTS